MRALILLLIAGCVDQGSGSQPKKIDASYVADHLLKELPPNVTRLDVRLGGKLTYLGNIVDKTLVVPGSAVHVRHYWRVEAPIGEGWRVFGLMRGQGGTADFMNLGPTDMEIGHGPATWKAGEIIEDLQDITLRPDWRSPIASLQVGLIATGAHGLGDRMDATGPHTLDRAVIARVFDVDLSKAPPPVGTIYIPHVQGKITIDGNLGDTGWVSSASTPEFLVGEGSPEPIGKASAKMTWDEQYLYLAVSITDSDIVSEYKNHDDPLWKADAVEIFIDADGNKRGYVELQVNPNNATFDSWFAGGRAPKGDEAWDSGMVTAVQRRTTKSATGDVDTGWDVEIAIPWAAAKGRDDQMKIHTPPEVGDRWKLNVVRVDHKTGDPNPTISSWNRITMGDFHALDRMLTAVFADATGSIVPKPAAPPGADGSGSGSAASKLELQAGSGSAAMPIDPHAGSGAGSGSAARPIDPHAGSGAGSGSAARPIDPHAGSGAGSGSAAGGPVDGHAGPGSAAPSLGTLQRINAGRGSAVQP